MPYKQCNTSASTDEDLAAARWSCARTSAALLCTFTAAAASICVPDAFGAERFCEREAHVQCKFPCRTSALMQARK